MRLTNRAFSLVLATAAAGLAGSGCAHQHSYADDRPPTDSLVEGNTGVQAKDVGAATDQMANDLLSLPELNVADKKWTIVLSGVTNKTADPTMSYGVFQSRLRSLLAQKGHGRIALIANKAEFHQQQNQELETPADNFGQGGGGSGNPAGIQPQYGLTITIDEMPNRATSYFLITADLTNLQTREQPWVGKQYEFQAPR